MGMPALMQSSGAAPKSEALQWRRDLNHLECSRD
jgi:hypothetical protein